MPVSTWKDHGPGECCCGVPEPVGVCCHHQAETLQAYWCPPYGRWIYDSDNFTGIAWEPTWPSDQVNGWYINPGWQVEYYEATMGMPEYVDPAWAAYTGGSVFPNSLEPYHFRVGCLSVEDQVLLADINTSQARPNALAISCGDNTLGNTLGRWNFGTSLVRSNSPEFEYPPLTDWPGATFINGKQVSVRPFGQAVAHESRTTEEPYGYYNNAVGGPYMSTAQLIAGGAFDYWHIPANPPSFPAPHTGCGDMRRRPAMTYGPFIELSMGSTSAADEIVLELVRSDTSDPGAIAYIYFQGSNRFINVQGPFSQWACPANHPYRTFTASFSIVHRISTGQVFFNGSVYQGACRLSGFNQCGGYTAGGNNLVVGTGYTADECPTDTFGVECTANSGVFEGGPVPADPPYLYFKMRVIE